MAVRKSMPDLETELPDIAGEIRKFAGEYGALREALADFETACQFEEALHTSEAERDEWARIRKETAQELRRLMSRLRPPIQGSEVAS